mmetsp:Transcript_51214/g.132958  ORF Transcript_51214/g.132958 Transcript_51214/m.132958 type:complete len:96 (+) Transcript_51214:1958-2245(+)
MFQHSEGLDRLVLSEYALDECRRFRADTVFVALLCLAFGELGNHLIGKFNFFFALSKHGSQNAHHPFGVAACVPPRGAVTLAFINHFGFQAVEGL